VDIIQYVTGGNVTIQAVLITSLSAWVSLWMATRKLKIEKEQFKKQFNSQKDSFEEQRRQFERTLQNQKTTTYKELITANRIKWLNDLRNCFIDTIDIGTEILIRDDEQTDNTDLVKKFIHSVDKIFLRLNPNEFDIEKILLEINRIILTMQMKQDGKEPQELSAKLASLRIEAQRLLKEEWEIIKEEANQLYHE